MNYKIRIRLITTKQGLKKIQNYLQLINDENIQKTIFNATIFKIYGDVVYLGWDNPPLYKSVESMLICLMSYHVTYRMCTINKMYDSFQMSYYTVPKDRHKNIPNIPVICRFDEKKLDEKLMKFMKKGKGESNE